MATLTLHEQFEKMLKERNTSPIIELDEEFDYDYFYLNSTENGLEAGGCCNTGFMRVDSSLFLPWDHDRTLDWHINELVEICEDYMRNKE